ncbi:hypothetical protein CAP35_04860 [Chitinophagaceae bacterium IBVUCB1]|nr:hypothetical protein CAP35_04860 [Chitinophagaceae bacterium IBVUCB1]
MRKIITLLLAVSLSPILSNAQFTKGLVAHWPFNGSANDASGKGLHGTPTAITYGAGQTGSANSAAIFNGTGSYINVPYKASMNTDTVSMCAIVKLNNYYTGNCEGNYIIARGDVSTNGGYGIQAYDNAYNTCGVLDTSKEVFGLMSKSITAAAAQQYSPNIVTKNWYCVIGTFDGKTAKMYINGVLKSTDILSSASSIGSSTSSITIGAYGAGLTTGYPYWVNGAIDDMRLYSRILTTTEIDSYCNHYNNLNGETAISETNQPSLNVFPNPADNHITVSGYLPTGKDVKIALLNAIGQVVMQDMAYNTNSTLQKQISLQNVPNGIYYMQLKTSEETQTLKLVVQH